MCSGPVQVVTSHVVVVPLVFRHPVMRAQEIVVEARGNVGHLGEVAPAQLYLILARLGSFVRCERHSTLESIADLPSVPDRARAIASADLLFKQFFAEVSDIAVANYLRIVPLGSLDVRAPDLFGFAEIQWWIVQRHMHARLESFVEDADLRLISNRPQVPSPT